MSKVVYRIVPGAKDLQRPEEHEKTQFQASDGSTGTVRRAAPCDGLWGRIGDALFWIPLERLKKDIAAFDLERMQEAAVAEVAALVKAKAKKGKSRGKR